jgi:molybdenum cofactor guanylyltransferase
LPLLKKIDFERLIASRNPHKLATAFYNPATELPDPLFTIWEPRAYPVLLSFLSLGYSCPRKVLIQAQIELVKVDNTDFLTNANSPEEKIWVQQQLRLNKQT